MPGFVRVLRNDLAEVPRMVDRFGAFARSNDLSDTLRQQMAIAFDEVVANIVTYGYDDDGEHHIAVRVDLDGGVLVVTVEDDGKPFDPLAEDDPDVTLGLDEREIGGLGIFLVKELMDEVTWERRADRNVLVLRKQVA